MRDRDLQHPAITAALNTGYPYDVHGVLVCDWCGGKIFRDETYYNIHGEILCAECVEDCKEVADDYE